MKKETSLCMGCMAEMKPTHQNNSGNPDICAVCGYAKNSVFLSSYLAPTTFLANRYIIGKLISYNGEGALYIAFDTLKNVRITLREYMPDTLCGRKKDAETIEVNPQYVALYKTYLSEFIELNRSLMGIDRSLGIQKVSEVFIENNTAYAVYEYIAGISLKSYLSNLGGVLPWEQVKELFAPLFTTLNLVHSAGIIHRGISPSTILFNDKGELVLINFGIAASRTHGYEINHEVYAGYAGPEQYSGVERHGNQTDVYGVAAVLYKVLTGQMPADASVRCKEDVLTEPALINRNVPMSVSSAIMNGLILNVGERTQTIGLLIDELFESSPLSMPDSTNEILIKKPLRAIETESPLTPGGAGAGVRRVEEKKHVSHTTAITVCVMLGLVLVTFITVIVLSARNPDLFNSWLPEESAASAAEGQNASDNAYGTTTPPVSTEPEEDSEPSSGINDASSHTLSNELYVVPDFRSRYFEVIQNNSAFVFLTFIPTYEFNDDFDEGLIFEQDKPHGSEVVKGTEITVKVSKGPETAVLPVFANTSLTDYKNLLSAAKIKYEVKGEHSSSVEKDFVIRCSAAAGDIINIAVGDTVTVYFSLGPEPEPEPAPEPEIEDELLPEPDYYGV
ncbi:MAG: PASTA domain-containing protein [Oscillospiraceae bacterium]|nr:PASTA domain-containing protein [Oscillospiraceae bacterium]